MTVCFTEALSIHSSSSWFQSLPIQRGSSPLQAPFQRYSSSSSRLIKLQMNLRFYHMVRLDMTSPPPWEHGIPPYWVLTPPPPALPNASRSKNNTEQDNSECHTYIFQFSIFIHLLFISFCTSSFLLDLKYCHICHFIPIKNSIKNVVVLHTETATMTDSTLWKISNYFQS